MQYTRKNLRTSRHPNALNSGLHHDAKVFMDGFMLVSGQKMPFTFMDLELWSDAVTIGVSEIGNRERVSHEENSDDRLVDFVNSLCGLLFGSF